MNDFHMSSLGADRIDGLRAEADRHRMARTERARPGPSHAPASQRPSRFGLGWLLRRAAA